MRWGPGSPNVPQQPGLFTRRRDEESFPKSNFLITTQTLRTWRHRSQNVFVQSHFITSVVLVDLTLFCSVPFKKEKSLGGQGRVEIRPVRAFLVYFILFSSCNYLAFWTPCDQTVFINNKIFSFINTYCNKYVKMTDAFLPESYWL